MAAPYTVSPVNGVFDPATGRLIGVAEQGPSGTSIRKLPAFDGTGALIDPATGTPVSGGGISIASADLATTTGAVGVLYTVTDGPQSGARITWGTPSGSSTPTWVWWLWPQSAF